MEREDHERLARELAEQTDRLKHAGDELQDEIDETRADWRAKQDDPAVPGAIKPPDADEDPPGPRSNT